jgi:hypothetical protein
MKVDADWDALPGKVSKRSGVSAMNFPGSLLANRTGGLWLRGPQFNGDHLVGRDDALKLENRRVGQ